MKKIASLITLLVGIATVDGMVGDWKHVSYPVGGKECIFSFIISTITAENYGNYAPEDVAIVNPVSSILPLKKGTKGSLSAAIFQAAGAEQLSVMCQEVLDKIESGEMDGGPLVAGDAVMIDGCALKPVARKIIFAIGANCRILEEQKNAKKLLAQSYQASLDLASGEQVKDIRFPVMSRMMLGLTVEEAASVSIDACLDYLEENPETTIKRICFVIHADKNSENTADILREIWMARQEKPKEKSCRSVAEGRKEFF